jgi:hypothetical protein
MKAIDYMTRGITVAANYPLDTQWRFAVVAMVLICLAGLLAVLPNALEAPGMTRVARACAPVVKTLRLIAGRRQDWRGALLDLFA